MAKEKKQRKQRRWNDQERRTTAKWNEIIEKYYEIYVQYTQYTYIGSQYTHFVYMVQKGMLKMNLLGKQKTSEKVVRQG